MSPETTSGASSIARLNGNQPESDSISRRDAYIKYCGFKRDPFRLPVAEQEYGFYNRDGELLNPEQKSGDGPKSIFTPRAYYVDPLYKDRREGSVFDQLRASGHAFVFGAPGNGKSTLRFALEAYLRGRPDGATLAVTYEPEKELAEYRGEGEETGAWRNPTHHPGRDVHLRLLARALTIDLFIQIVEQFSFREETPTTEQNRQLYNLILDLDRTRLNEVKQVIARLKDAEASEPSRVWGSAGLWRRFDRPVVVAVMRTPKMRAWLENLLEAGGEDAAAPSSGEAQWQRALEAARLWGFSRGCVLVDGLDANDPKTAHMLGRLDPLLRALPDFNIHNVSLKFFLPAELESGAIERLASHGNADGIRTIRLRWTPERLEALIQERYRAAGGRRSGLSDLVVPQLRDRIDALLITESQGSPRRLVTLVDELIEAHVERGPIKEPISLVEWEKAVAATNKRLPAPVAKTRTQQISSHQKTKTVKASHHKSEASFHTKEKFSTRSGSTRNRQRELILARSKGRDVQPLLMRTLRGVSAARVASFSSRKRRDM
jgi:hypothetical protein